MKYFVVLDFEATCDEENAPSPQEIIEFPSVLVDAESLQIVDEFREYVKPLHHPQLRAFCTELTGIEQHQVENAGSFPEVFKRHQEWLLSHNLSLSESLDEITWAFVSCGDWDLGTMLPVQEGACNTKLNTPTCYTRWINIKVPYGDIMGEKAYGMVGMLKGLNLTLDGRHHSGLDDSRNIAKILIALYKKQAIDKITGKRVFILKFKKYIFVLIRLLL